MARSRRKYFLQTLGISLQDLIPSSRSFFVIHGRIVASDLELVTLSLGLVGVLEADHFANEHPTARRNIIAQHGFCCAIGGVIFRQCLPVLCPSDRVTDQLFPRCNTHDPRPARRLGWRWSWTARYWSCSGRAWFACGLRNFYCRVAFGPDANVSRRGQHHYRAENRSHIFPPHRDLKPANTNVRLPAQAAILLISASAVGKVHRAMSHS